MLSIIYNLLIMPIQIVIELVYTIVSRYIGNKGICIIAVSTVIQILIAPLYLRSDQLQKEENDKQREMSYWVNHIKKTFSGDERFMMLQTYYREQNYKPVYALKSSFSLLLQIPFFIAAYNYLSNLYELSGESFLIISDLSKPDAVFTIGNFPVNILPVMMTAINIISGYIYTRGQSIKDKARVYGLALVFLVLLYNSPSGLVLYWTMNNVYSLLKNIILETRAAKWIADIRNRKIAQNKLIIRIKKCFDNYRDGRNADSRYFVAATVFLALLMGILIPSMVINASATEFVVENNHPLSIIVNNGSIFIGLLVVWFGIFYYLMSDTGKYWFTLIMLCLDAAAITNYLCFGTNNGTMSGNLVYDTAPVYDFLLKLGNITVIAVIVLLIVILFNRVGSIKQILVIAIACMIVISIYNIYGINKQMESYDVKQDNLAHEDIVNISTSGKNVVVIMLDRALSGFVPIIFEHNPKIAEDFKDFVYYPNTLSFGLHTNFATPALFGGYEYTPEEINKRPDKKLMDEQNEALKLMPAVFTQNGYDVTVCDPPYAGYQWISDLSIFDGMKGVNTYISEGAFAYKRKDYLSKSTVDMQKSNFLYYSIMKTAPLVLQNFIYNNGSYCSTYVPKGEAFINGFTTLVSFDDMTNIVDDNSNNLFIISNIVTHELCVLSTPDYVPTDDWECRDEQEKARNENIKGVENWLDLAYYTTNAAAYKWLGEWMNGLKESGAYDNTRIIIVSDHGEGLGQFDEMLINEDVDVEAVNSVLMVKDFNADYSSYVTDNSFMTIADVPYIAMNSVIDNPVNPFTGKAISDRDKTAHSQKITFSNNYSVAPDLGTTFDTSDSYWYEVQDNIFDVNNWNKMEQ